MENKIQHHKIIIIGAGPTGATLSLTLSKNKIHHLILDKAIFPRDKTCGDGLTPEVPRILKEISEDLYQEFVNAPWVQKSYGSYVELRNGWNSFMEMKNYSTLQAPYYVAKRIYFDDFLVKKIPSPYVEFHQNYSVEHIERKENIIYLTVKNSAGEKEEFSCNLLIGADGERSIVRKTFHPEGIKKNRAHHAGALRCYYKNVEKVFEGDPLELYQCNNGIFGYFWIFHLPNNECNVGIGDLSLNISDKKINLRNELQNYINGHPQLKKRFNNAEPLETPKGWGIPFNSNAHSYAGDNYLLIGDSGSMGEPLTGKGIGVAMFAAFLSVEVILKAIEKNDFSLNVLKEYELKIEKKFRKEWKRLYFLQNLFTKNKYVYWLFLPLKSKFLRKIAAKDMMKRIDKFVFKSHLIHRVQKS